MKVSQCHKSRDVPRFKHTKHKHQYDPKTFLGYSLQLKYLGSHAILVVVVVSLLMSVSTLLEEI